MQVAANPASVRWPLIFGGQLFATASSGTFVNVFTVGTGLPQTAGQTNVSLPGMPTTGSSSPYAYVFFDLDPTVAGNDTLYVADDRAAASGGGVQKWTLVNGTWTLGADLQRRGHAQRLPRAGRHADRRPADAGGDQRRHRAAPGDLRRRRLGDDHRHRRGDVAGQHRLPRRGAVAALTGSDQGVSGIDRPMFLSSVAQVFSRVSRARGLAVVGLLVVTSRHLAVDAPARADAPARVTLDEAVSRALQSNPTVAIAIAEIDRADALLRQARAAYFPSLIGDASYTRLDSDRRLNARATVTAAENQVAANLQLTVPLFAPVARANSRHAEDNRHIAEASAVDVRRQLAVATARAYLAVVAQHRVITANENARNTAQAHYDYAHTRFAGGVGRSIDEVRAEQELRTNEVNVEGAYAALVHAKEALGVLDQLATARSTPSTTSRSDSRRAWKRRSTTRARSAPTSRRCRPASPPASTWSRTTGSTTRRSSRPSASRSTSTASSRRASTRTGWQASLILTLPLYDGGLRTGIAREHDALVVESRASLDLALRQAQSDVRAAFDGMVHADKALIAARAAADARAARARAGQRRLQGGRDVQPGSHRRLARVARRRHRRRAVRGPGAPGAAGSAGGERPVSRRRVGDGPSQVADRRRITDARNARRHARRSCVTRRLD